MSKHVHRFKVSAGNHEVTLEVCGCGEKRQRPATGAERRSHLADMKALEDEAVTNRVVREFFREFRSGPNGEHWNWKAYDLIERIEEWAKKHPRDVHVMPIDDETHSSSLLAFILHRNGERLWGTTVVGVTQNDGQPPFTYFMYPDHAMAIGLAIEAMETFRPWSKTDELLADRKKSSLRYFPPFGIRRT